MSAELRRVKDSRDAWKQKSVLRSQTIKNRDRTIRRLKMEAKKSRAASKKLAEDNEKLKQRSDFNTIPEKTVIIFLTLNLFCSVRLGFRATSRVMQVISQLLGFKRAPCAQSVINYVCKLSISRMTQKLNILNCGHNFTNGWAYMIDESIALTGQKILVVAAISGDFFRTNQRAPKTSDLKPIASVVSSSWTGESIKDVLKEVISVTGRPLYYVSDRGNNIRKAISLLEEDNLHSPVINDVSHFAANLLKDKYNDLPEFNDFITSCGKISKNLKQSVLACLAPPKNRIKGRFMSVSRLVYWGKRVLNLIKKSQESSNPVMGSVLIEKASELTQYKDLINSLISDIKPIESCQKILKMRGLSKETHQECKRLLFSENAIHMDLLAWMSDVNKTSSKFKLEDEPTIASTDALESLFGTSKQHGTGKIKDPNRIALRIPSLCGKVTVEEAIKVQEISTKTLKQETENLPSVHRDRIGVLSGTKDIETVGVEKKVVRLLPKKGDKNRNTIALLSTYREGLCPPTAG